MTNTLTDRLALVDLRFRSTAMPDEPAAIITAEEWAMIRDALASRPSAEAGDGDSVSRKDVLTILQAMSTHKFGSVQGYTRASVAVAMANIEHVLAPAPGTSQGVREITQNDADRVYGKFSRLLGDSSSGSFLSGCENMLAALRAVFPAGAPATSAETRESSPVGRDEDWPHDLGKIIEDCRERFGTPYADAVLNDLIHRVGSARTTPAPTPDAAPSVRDDLRERMRVASEKFKLACDTWDADRHRSYAGVMYALIGEYLAASPAVPSTQTEGAVARVVAAYYDKGAKIFRCTIEGCHELSLHDDLYTHPTPVSTPPAVSVDEAKRIVEKVRERTAIVSDDGRLVLEGRKHACDEITAALDNLSGSAK